MSGIEFWEKLRKKEKTRSKIVLLRRSKIFLTNYKSKSANLRIWECSIFRRTTSKKRSGWSWLEMPSFWFQNLSNKSKSWSKKETPYCRKKVSEEVVKDEVINPTFFAGISQFKNSDEYATYLRSIAKDENKLYEMFASQVFALGKINQRKNENVRLSLFFFITALISELLIIMSMAYSRALPYLFPTGWNIPYQFLYLHF